MDAAASPIQSFITNVSIPSYTSRQAPISIVVSGAASASGDEIAREYRQVDGQLFRQVWGVEDRESGRVIPVAPQAAAWGEGSERGAAGGALAGGRPENQQRPVTASGEHRGDEAAVGADAGTGGSAGSPVFASPQVWAPFEPGRVYELRPVPADEEWLRQEAERSPAVSTATAEEAARAVQARMDQFAAIDGAVWQVTPEPVYRAPVVDDAPFTEPLTVAVLPAPDTSMAAADVGYFPADSYAEAILTMHETAAAVGVSVAPGQNTEDPPIRWLRELGLIDSPLTDEHEWRSGTPLTIEPSETLTEGTFRDRLASLREQIVTIPGAVTGDVGSFLVVGDWKLDFAALTRQQQDEYRRYIIYGVEHGLI
ncbi:hypothetical protein [Microbacterium gorillae]|uniref:hypothetical protein n=1 Tax=Microbacterium gorillae TaxID=1231063 RepID=UPI003D99C6CC